MIPVIVHTPSPGQAPAWAALPHNSRQMPHGWTIVGGQMVLPWCPERQSTLARPTKDIDTVLNSLATHGGQHALDPAESIDVVVDGQPGTVRRTSLIGALVAKSATVEIAR